MKRNNNSRTDLFRSFLAKKSEMKTLLAYGSVSLLLSLNNVVGLMANEGAEGEAAEGLNPLSWTTDLAIWTGVVFLLLVAVLGKFAFGPIVKALDAREQAMLDKVNSAEKANADARELLTQYRQKLADSEREVRQMLDDAKAEAKKVGDEIVDNAKAAAQEEHQKALKEIESATNNALTGLAAKSAELATDLAGKILKEKINPQDHANLINSAIGEFSKN